MKIHEEKWKTEAVKHPNLNVEDPSGHKKKTILEN